MLSDELLSELQNLSRAEKLRVVQLLVNELATAEETLLKSGEQYEVWSPHDAPEAAQALLKMLEADKKSGNA